MTAPPAEATFAGAVLCGGASRRMGRDKALVPIGGTPMAVRVAEALRVAGAAEVRAVGGDADALGALGLAVQPDDRPGDGPLAATATALRTTSAPVVLVVSCDLVEPDPAALRSVVDAVRAAPEVLAAVPVDAGGHPQWTHAAWRTAAAPTLAAAVADGERSLRRVGARVRHVTVSGLPAGALRDADAPEDLPPAGSLPDR